MVESGDERQEQERLMPLLGRREDYMDYLDGEVTGTVSGLSTGQLTHGLAKSYILETVREDQPALDPLRAFGAGSLRPEWVGEDEDLLRLVHVGRGGVVAVVEGLQTRYPVLHTTLEARHADPFVRKLVDASSMLDHIWLSGRFFDRLWRWTERVSPPHRIVRLKFMYEAFYERDVETEGAGPDVDLLASESGEETEAYVLEPGDEPEASLRERRRSLFTVADRLDALTGTIGRLRDVYNPLQSTVSLRVPATGRGGFEIYDYGKVTNRSESFAEHRQVIDMVTGLYGDLTQKAEEIIWFGSTPLDGAGDGVRLSGTPVYLRFNRPLAPDTLSRWVINTFNRRQNRFRLGGQPLWMGPANTKVHIYGIDRHLWQPLSIEATTKHMIVLLPRGTCGNSVNRLVTNVQQYLDPSVEAWVGEHSYTELIEQAGLGAVA